MAGNIAHPTNPSRFIQCSFGRAAGCHNCAGNLVFNPTGQYCDYDYNVNNNRQQQPTASPTTAKSVPTTTSEATTQSPAVSPEKTASSTNSQSCKFCIIP